MSTLTHWRRQANRYGRDLVRVTPGGKIGLLVVGGLGALFGYRRYYQIKVGDVVLANLVALGIPAPQAGGIGSAQGQCKVLAVSGDQYTVSPIIGGVQAPASGVLHAADIVQNLTPRLF